MTAAIPAGRSLRIGADGRLTDRDVLDDPDLRRLLALLGSEGEEARVVGGAVRNALLGLPPGDVDVATTALPDVVMARAKAARMRPIPTGIAHGTVTVRVGGSGFEVTTLREDVETDGRHAVVRFGRDFAADAQRRDFTINALSVTADGWVHDTTGGVADLAEGRVRFIGEADTRIREDYLRILRLFRFHAAYGVGDIDAEGLAAATRHRDALARLSRERIRAELLKLLEAAGAAPVLARMVDAGIAEVVLGGPGRPDRVARMAAFDATCGEPPDALLRLAALAIVAAPDVLRLREMLRLSNGEQARLAAAVEARRSLADTPPDTAGLRKLLFRAGAQGAADGVRLAAAMAEPDAAGWPDALAFVRSEAPPRLPLGGADIMARGVRPGRTVGAVLKRLQAAWIRAGFPKDPVSLGALLDAAIVEENRDP